MGKSMASVRMISSLALSDLRIANVMRCEDVFHPLDSWSPTDWACAAAGEMGETCNKIKKMRRGEKVPLQDVAYEIADTVIYLDLLAARLGINLDDAVRSKFNLVSDKKKSKVKL